MQPLPYTETVLELHPARRSSEVEAIRRGHRRLDLRSYKIGQRTGDRLEGAGGRSNRHCGKLVLDPHDPFPTRMPPDRVPLTYLGERRAPSRRQ
jgi:hypothetical protein